MCIRDRDSTVKLLKQILILLTSSAAPSVIELVTNAPLPISIERAAQSSTSISFTRVVNFANTFETGANIILIRS